MALLVCYSAPDRPPDWRDRAAYLGQQFYETLPADRVTFPILSRLATMRYGDELVLTRVELAPLVAELGELAREHPELSTDADALRTACNNAHDSQRELSVGGDMHPERAP